MAEVVVLQIFDVLKAVAQIAKEGMIQVFQHPPLPDYISDALGPYDYIAS